METAVAAVAAREDVVETGVASEALVALEKAAGGAMVAVAAVAAVAAVVAGRGSERD